MSPDNVTNGGDLSESIQEEEVQVGVTARVQWMRLEITEPRDLDELMNDPLVATYLAEVKQ